MADGLLDSLRGKVTRVGANTAKRLLGGRPVAPKVDKSVHQDKVDKAHAVLELRGCPGWKVLEQVIADRRAALINKLLHDLQLTKDGVELVQVQSQVKELDRLTSELERIVQEGKDASKALVDLEVGLDA